MKKKVKNNQVIIYQAKNGAIELRGDNSRETFWATQAQIARLFDVTPQNVTLHLNNIYKDKELEMSTTCKESLQVQIEGKREIKRTVKFYNLDAIIAVGYRINSVLGTNFRIWATKTLRGYIINGFVINRKQISVHYSQFLEAVENIKQILPGAGNIDQNSVLELISAFANTWLSLEAYDKDKMVSTGNTKKSVVITADKLKKALGDFKNELLKKGEATEIFGQEKHRDAVGSIVGNVMQSFGGKSLYATVEEKAAHLLYFLVKDHPFTDGNKRSGAFAFVWFLKKAGLLDSSKITPPALTAITLFIAESNPKQKDKMIKLVLQLLKK